MAERTHVEQVPPSVIMMTRVEMIKLLAVSAIIGLVTIGLHVLLERYLFVPALCGGEGVGSLRCESAPNVASGLALVLGGIAALFYFVQQRIYRPLLVVLLVGAALWGVPALIAEQSIVVGILLSAALFALAYGAFAWIVQVRNFVIALVLSLVLVIGLRLLISL